MKTVYDVVMADVPRIIVILIWTCVSAMFAVCVVHIIAITEMVPSVAMPTARISVGVGIGLLLAYIVDK